MKYSLILLFTLLFMMSYNASAQIRRNDPMNRSTQFPQNQGFDGDNTFRQTGTYGEYDEEERGGSRTTWGRDSTKHKKEKPIPMGQFQWVLEPRLGTVIDAENNDTVVHNFQSWNNTDGYQGQYSYLANMGSPRLNRIFMEREDNEDFMLLRPLDYFRGGLSNFRFTNTKSPITNLAYHKCGNDQNGEDRVRGYFATNINHISGIGFKMDYLYGKGYYTSSTNSMFGTTGFGYYRGEKYNMHAYVNVNHMKMFENGGIEDDDYIENPQSYENSYTSTEIPVMLTDTWNRNHENNYYLTHKYNFGYNKEIEVPDSLKPIPPTESELLDALSDSIRNVLAQDNEAKAHVVDSLMKIWADKQETPTEFVPVASIVHTFDMRSLEHAYISHIDAKNYYTKKYLENDGKGAYDITNAYSIRNTFGLQMREGFNKWTPFGLTLFATHKLRSYTLLDKNPEFVKKYSEHDVSVGGELARTQGKLLHFNATGEIWVVGENAGNFTVDGKTAFEFALKKDSLILDLHAFVKHEKPDFFFRHFHSQYAWWDNENLDREIRTRIEGVLRLKKFGTKLKFGIENVSNYTYLTNIKTPLVKGADDTSTPPEATQETTPTITQEVPEGSTKPTDYSNETVVRQKGSSIQVLSATLSQDLKFGPVHWDTELTYQQTSDKDRLPLPQLNVYSNIYLLFRIAKVLRVQLGADVRYFTKYYAPEWSPALQQFVTQDTNQPRVEIGNYPIINAYANLHIKHCRLYVSANHVNAGNGKMYLSPHYPINPMTIHFGLSWNFFN